MNQNLNSINWKEVYDRGIINIGNLARMKRVMEKATSGKEITIGFLGGSITAGAAATSPETCYAYRVFEWWERTFPRAKCVYINAGIGATSSKFGVARVEEDVLIHKPDMVFVEFSVNDEDTSLYQETFEGLIRKLLLTPVQPALFMFNNVFYDDGRNAQRVHNEIGKYYDLPIVSMKESLYRDIEKGNLNNTDISEDNLHPNDFGHGLVAGVITNLLDLIHEQVVQRKEEYIEYHVPEKPITKNRYITSVRRNNLSITPELNGFYPDKKPKENVWDNFRNGWFGNTVGSSITFEVEGATIAIQYRKYAVHPAPIAKVVIDQDEQKAVILDANFEETWGDCLYLQDVMIADKPGKHKVTITIDTEVEDKDFYLVSVITS